MKVTVSAVGILALILLAAVPVGGSSMLQVGSRATYDLKATISFQPTVCETTSSPTVDPNIIVECPLIAVVPMSININGTLGWTATGLNANTVNLNVTRDVTISSEDLMIPAIHRTGSFNESINLATRIISIMPFLKTEMDDALQMAQSSTMAPLPTGVDPTAAMTIVESRMLEQHPVYTMWWINGTPAQGQKIPVLIFNTTVKGPTTVNLGALGNRPAWALVFNLTSPGPQPEMSVVSPVPAGLRAVFTFNYDQKSDLLLSASVDIHIEFVAMIPQSTQCTMVPATTMNSCVSPDSSVMIPSSSGFNINATLTLASTSLNLDQPIGSTGSSGGTSSSGSGSGTGSGSGSGSGTGTGSGSGSGTGSGTGSGSGSTGSTGTGSGPGTGSGSGSGSGSGNTPKSTANVPSNGLPSWLYWILGVVAVAIVATGLTISRRRRAKTQPQISPVTSAN